MTAFVLSEQWLHPDNYAYWSSEAGGVTVKVLTVLVVVLVVKLLWPRIWRHFECDVETPENCHRRGYTVPGTGHKACGAHHPHRHDKETRPTTVEDILHHHEESGA